MFQGVKIRALQPMRCQRWAEIVLKLKVIFCYDIGEHRQRERAKYNRSDCAEEPFRGSDTEGGMYAAHHLAGMLNGLVLIDTLHSLIPPPPKTQPHTNTHPLTHTHTKPHQHHCNLWLMRPWAKDGSIKEPPPPPFLSFSLFPPPLTLSRSSPF